MKKALTLCVVYCIGIGVSISVIEAAYDSYEQYADNPFEGGYTRPLDERHRKGKAWRGTPGDPFNEGQPYTPRVLKRTTREPKTGISPLDTRNRSTVIPHTNEKNERFPGHSLLDSPHEKKSNPIRSDKKESVYEENSDDLARNERVMQERFDRALEPEEDNVPNLNTQQEGREKSFKDLASNEGEMDKHFNTIFEPYNPSLKTPDSPKEIPSLGSRSVELLKKRYDQGCQIYLTAQDKVTLCGSYIKENPLKVAAGLGVTLGLLYGSYWVLRRAYRGIKNSFR